MQKTAIEATGHRTQDETRGPGSRVVTWDFYFCPRRRMAFTLSTDGNRRLDLYFEAPCSEFPETREARNTLPGWELKAEGERAGELFAKAVA